MVPERGKAKNKSVSFFREHAFFISQQYQFTGSLPPVI